MVGFFFVWLWFIWQKATLSSFSQNDKNFQKTPETLLSRCETRGRGPPAMELPFSRLLKTCAADLVDDIWRNCQNLGNVFSMVFSGKWCCTNPVVEKTIINPVGCFDDSTLFPWTSGRWYGPWSVFEYYLHPNSYSLKSIYFHKMCSGDKENASHSSSMYWAKFTNTIHNCAIFRMNVLRNIPRWCVISKIYIKSRNTSFIFRWYCC